MTGEYQHSLDAKGRLFIPARLREELGSEFYVTISMEHCLCAYSLEMWKAFEAKAAALPYRQQKLVRSLFSNAVRCELDAQGRILISANLREHAGLKKNVTVVGTINHAEFWDSEEWAEINAVESSPESIAAAMEALDF